ncbi:thioredoxin family protein [Natronomonas sp. EA1]|uniref:thioredoxin family protein n=1 Tax=Natronomonas sp. EA1 TaxID=3421655 RepID=UPI003EB6CB35
MSAMDADRLFDRLVDAGVLTEREDEVVKTADFESTLDIYRSTYGDASDERFREVVAELFDLSPEAAETKIDELGISREQLCILLSLRSEVEATPEALLQMVGMVDAVSPASPVPEGLPELGADFADVLVDGQAVVLVFTHGCEPCDALKAELPAIESAAPSDVRLFGIDGPERHDFLRAHEVTGAPTALFFSDGEVVDRLEGFYGADTFEARFAEHY